jgi:hypothetical protein
MKKLVLLVLAFAGCTTIEFQDSYPNSFAKQHVEAVLPLATEKALSTPDHMLTRLKADESRSVGTWGTGTFTEVNFRYVYRQNEKEKPLSILACSRVIDSVYSDTLNAIGKGAGKVTESKCEASTFLISYKSVIGDRPTIGTIRGGISVNGDATILVDVREETEGK